MEITGGTANSPVISFKVCDRCGTVRFVNARQNFANLLQRIYTEGLGNRSFLDCACNCGGYSFWAKNLGAGRCFGFDIRQHWIDQAQFLAEHRIMPSDNIRFERCDLYDLPKLGLDTFDITLFNGIFYHLPDPISGLKIAADLTNELLIITTAARNDLPDGMLAVSHESEVPVMSGIYGLNWYPTGPETLAPILKWMGFPATRVIVWRRKCDVEPANLGHLQIIAARDARTLSAFDAAIRARKSDTN